jgi:DNA polymerase I-like protein with 3'-5' exonuclease and polymerase domains
MMNEFYAGTIAVDIETVGEIQDYALQAYRYNGESTRIRAISYAWVDDTGLHTEAHIDPSIELMRGFFSRFADRKWVGWNVCFDVSWFQAAGMTEVYNLEWLDGMLLWMHTYRIPEKDKGKRKSYALKAAMSEFYPEHAGFKDFEDFQTDDPAQLKLLLNRNRMDAAFTLKLAEKFWSELSQEQRVAAIIESACIPLVAHTFNQGLKIDVQAAQDLRSVLTGTAQDIYDDLVEANPEVANVDLGSPKQLGELIYSQWGLTAPKKTDKGADSTDKEALTDLADTDHRAAQLQKYREAVNTCTKFVDGPLNSAAYNGDGFTRPQAKIFGTYTGRMTYYSKQGKGKSERPTGIAIHQWPRDKRFRGLICPPDGYTLLEFDFAGQEFRWMAVAAEDETMLGLCALGEDPHSYMGSKVAGVGYGWLKENAGIDPEAKKIRNLGKFSNLSFQYRIGATAAAIKAKTQYGLRLEKHFVQGLINTYKKTYWNVPKYWNTQIYKCGRLGYAETYAGRRVQLNSVSGWERDSTSINYPIQGSGADQKYLALAVARTKLPKYGAYFYMELHDGLFFICPNDKAEALCADLLYSLSNLPYKQAWGVEFPIQFPVDAKMSNKSWGDLKEVK